MFVIDVLIGAATTATEIWTQRFDAVRRRFFKIDNLRFGELFFLAHDLRGNFFVFDRKRNENGLAVVAGHALSAESDVFDAKIDNTHSPSRRSRRPRRQSK